MNDKVEQLSKELQDHMAAGSVELPLLPKVASRVLNLVQDPDSDVTQLARLIETDPALAGHVMKIANSAAYTPNINLVSLQQAIARLGMNIIAEIALSVSVTAKMFNAPGFEKLISEILKHSVSTGFWSREVARVVRRNVESAFLCGLLHEMGVPVTIQAVSEIALRLGIQLDEADMEQLIDRHATAMGVMIAEHWHLPEIVLVTIRQIRDHQNAQQERNLVLTVYCAAQFARHMLDEEDLSEEALREAPILEDMNLYPEDVQTLLDKLPNVQGAMAAISL